MARPRSEDKRAAILEAAAEAVAVLGVSAPTAKIAKGAGVAEGTLFTYFPSKDELLNRLYLQLKMDLRDAMMDRLPCRQEPHRPESPRLGSLHRLGFGTSLETESGEATGGVRPH
jgi:AcrR family transcriptional regulator